MSNHKEKGKGKRGQIKKKKKEEERAAPLTFDMSRLYNFTAESSTYEGTALIFTLHLKKKKPPNETRNMKSSKQLMGINKEKKKRYKKEDDKKGKRRDLCDGKAITLLLQQL